MQRRGGGAKTRALGDQSGARLTFCARKAHEQAAVIRREDDLAIVANEALLAEWRGKHFYQFLE